MKVNALHQNRNGILHLVIIGFGGNWVRKGDKNLQIARSGERGAEVNKVAQEGNGWLIRGVALKRGKPQGKYLL